MQGLKHMLGYELLFQEERIGEVEDFLVDEEAWTVPYIAVRTGGELSDAVALTPTGSVVAVDRDRRAIKVAATIDEADDGQIPSRRGRTALRSGKEIAVYGINSPEGPCGVCVDLLADIDSWELPYLVVNTKQRFPNRHVLVPTAWVRNIDWREMQTHVAVHRLMIQQAQRFEPVSHDAA